MENSDNFQYMEIGKKIKTLRQDRGLNQRQLADLLDVPYSSLSQWESNKIFPSKKSLEKLSDFFGVPFIDDGKTMSSEDREIIALLPSADREKKLIILSILKRI